jgi:CheY-like chemotaxis protein
MSMTIKKRIVVIDDESHIRQVIARKLERAGYEVHMANDGTDGLELAREVEPDLLITDLQMPNMGGLELCAACREDPQMRTIPIILVTGSVITITEIESKTEVLGNILCLSKPFSPRKLLQKVKSILNSDNGGAS